MRCKFCNINDHFDNKEFLVVDGSWVTMYANFDKYGKLYIYAQADGETDRYYPKYCPECGKRLK